MRIILSLLLVIYLDSAEAKNFYFSAISGNDSRTSSQAQSSATPWKTLNKLNAIFSSLQPGDSVLFKRGETFYGLIKANKSGTTSRPIIIGAYGTGSKPVITGMQSLSDWTSGGSGKYDSYNPALGAVINMVTINGAEYAMGRYPNSTAANNGYLNFQSHGANYINDKQLLSSPAWKGAELVVRSNHYIIDRVKITAHSGNKISYSPALSYEPTDGYGYFIQNSVATLDQLGEWYYNPATKKMTVYFGAKSPKSYEIKASVLDNVLYIYDVNNIQFDNIAFTGGNKYTVYLYSSENIVIKNCDISFSGIDGISANNTTGLIVQNSRILYSNNFGINLSNSIGGVINNNQIKNTSLLQGMGQNSANKSIGIRETGLNNLIEYNQVDSSGYMGIRFGGNYCVIKNNLVNYFNLIKDDGGGIYTSSTYNGTCYGQKITGNIVLNGIGAAEGTTALIAGSTSGIYLDDYTNNIEVSNNTVAFCNKAGILVHNSQKVTLAKNTIYDNHNQQLLMSHNLTQVTSAPLRNINVKDNILFSPDAAQGVVNISTVANDISLAGTMDSNYYCRPLDDNFVMKTSFVNSAGTSIKQDCDLQGWRAFYKKDMSTKRTDVQIMSHKVKALIGPNKFANGDFKKDIHGATVYSTGTSVSASWVNNKIDGGTLQVVTSSKKTGLTTVTIPVGAVSTAKKYIIGFSVKSSKDTLMYVYARTAGAPYKILSNDGNKTILRMSSVRKDYELAFSPTIDEANPIIFLETPSQNSAWWLDNIKIYEADVSMTNPNDSIRFEYNATQLTKTVSLAGTYIDAKGAVYANSIVLKPYTSAVLIRKGGEVKNQSPKISLTSPTNNSKYNEHATIKLVADASDTDGTVRKVEFYKGTELVHSEFYYPYTFSMENTPAGTYIFTARAVDNSGNITKSAPVKISVLENDAPAVSITSPTKDSKYTASSTITLTAKASDADGTIKKVEFYNGTKLINTVNSSPYTCSWTKVASGKYTVTAKATDNSGNVTVSSGVVVTVAPSATLSMSSSGSSAAGISNDSSGTHTSNRPAPTASSDKSLNLKLFPNPVVDKIEISFEGLPPNNQKATLSIVDLLGKTVKNIPMPYSGQNIEVDVSSLSTGVYILRFSGDNILVNKKFVKKR